MNVIKELIPWIIQSTQFQHFRMAAKDVLYPFLSLLTAFAVGFWAANTIFSLSITSLTAFLPDIIRSFIKQYAFLIVILFFVIVGVIIYRKYKWYEDMHSITMVEFNKVQRPQEKLIRCELEISFYEGRKEILEVKRQFIQALSPIPIATAILGYILEKAKIAHINWTALIMVCVVMIAIYMFSYNRNIAKLQRTLLIIHRWNEVKCRISTVRDKAQL